MSKNLNKKYWEFKNITVNSADLYMYGEISSWEYEGSTSASSFKKDLDDLGDVSNINLYINSPGGDVFEGISIGSMIQRHKATVTGYVDGLAASIASVILASCNKVIMPTNAMVMIHNALTFSYGNAGDFRKIADDLEKITGSLRQTYLDKTGEKLTEEKLIELMDAESWLSASQCLEYGLCDEVIPASSMVASISNKFANKFTNVPKNIVISEEVKNMSKEVDPIIDEPTIEPTEGIIEEPVVDLKDKEISDLKAEIEILKNTEKDLTEKLDNANNKIIALDSKINELQPIVDTYNLELENKSKEENEALLNTQKEFYKNKFENLGAKDKFDTEEVQLLINSCVDSADSLSKLNAMVVDLISLDDSKIVNKRIEPIKKIGNLIPETNSAEKYGFK